MDREIRSLIQRATQAARGLLESEYAEQLEGVFDIHRDGTIATETGEHLNAAQSVLRNKIVAAIEYQRTTGMSKADAVASYLREVSFTTLNRFVALKMLEARDLVQECVSRGDQSLGFKEFTGLAPGLVQLPDRGYRVYIESLFDEIGREVRVLFDRRDPVSLLWPRRQKLLDLLAILNSSDIGSVWGEDETIGWVYQYFNKDDERRQMRAESQSPRNSREIAVRNQFFTPRYVVQFLTDNTLGRIWYEMRQGDTHLRDLEYLICRPMEVFLAEGEDSPEDINACQNHTQDDLSQSPTYVPFRPKKDPRDIRILDPACGSGHFLLYAFDLLLEMYQEAWADAASPASDVTGHTLRDDYPVINLLREAIPGLILRYNLHGIDIDSRCAQIAALAVWMRAQSAFKEQDIAQESRPSIRKTNIVVAEPMPGETNLRREFVETLDPKLGRLVERVFDRMNLAGEAGILLRIEEEIWEAVREIYGQHGDLFLASDKDEWSRAETNLLQALYSYVENSSNDRVFGLRLFAEDAARGLGFIDLCTRRYDVAVMNPPFGKASRKLEQYTRQNYPNSWTDLYGTFLDRMINGLAVSGFVGAITSSLFLYTKQLRWIRKRWVETKRLGIVAELGSGVLDSATVDTTLTVTVSGRLENSIFFDFTTAQDKSADMRADLNSTQVVRSALRDLSSFDKLYGAPFAYHINKKKLALWQSDERIDPSIGTLTSGNRTFDDFRFLRLRREVSIDEIGRRWIVYEKGGKFQPFLSPSTLVYNWANDGQEACAFQIKQSGTDAQVKQSITWWGSPGITYPSVSSIGFGPRLMLRGQIFSSKAISLFPVFEEHLLPTLALLSSSWSQDLLYAFGRYRSIEVRATSNLPFGPAMIASVQTELTCIAEEAIQIIWSYEADSETSPLYEGRLPRIERLEGLENELRILYKKIDAIVMELLLLESTDLVAQPRSDLVPKFACIQASRIGWAVSTVSFLVGCVFGRWTFSADLSESPRLVGTLLQDGIPPAQPGFVGLDGVPSIASDDQGSEHDLERCIDEYVETVGKRHLLEKCCEEGGEQNWLRKYLRKDFFADHLRRYSASRRRAPIYWQLSTPSIRYSVWLYYPRLTGDSLFRVLADILTPKLRHEERQLLDMVQRLEHDTEDSVNRRLLAEQESIVFEIRAFRDEITYVAPLWNPDFNDGVVINFAPLWRLVPQHKSWQKECKAVWDNLCKGDYDWAHLAMHLWPERVVPKCAEDRSLAVAHGLEDAFWYEDSDGKWYSRKISQSDVEDMVKERASAAVKDALESLLAAPPPATGRVARKNESRVKSIRKRVDSTDLDAVTKSVPLPTHLSGVVDVEILKSVRHFIASSGVGISKADVINATGISVSEWNKAIKALLADGSVIQTGERRGARYHPGRGDI